MNCDPINLTKEQVTNILMHRGLLFDLAPEDTVNDILNRYKFLQDNMFLPEGEDTRYTIFSNEILERFSTLAKERYESRVGKSNVAKSTKYPNNIKKKDAGTRIHAILADLMLVKLGKKELSIVRSNASIGKYNVSGTNFKALVNLVDEVYEDIQKLQKEIDPKGKVNILVEQRILDPTQNRGGTMDIHAVFSDGTGLIYDYKTTHSSYENYQGNELVDDLLHENKIADNELTMAEYKRVAIQRMGVKEIRQTRLIPIHLRLELKPEGQQKQFDNFTDKVVLIEAGRNYSDFLKPIPVAGEATKYKGINEVLDRQYNLINSLNKKLEKSGISVDESDRIKAKISSLRKAIRSTLVDGEIDNILETIYDLLSEVQERISIPEKTKDGKINPLYISDEELYELNQEIKIYTDIVQNTSIYYRDLQEESPKAFEHLRKGLSTVGSNISRAQFDVAEELSKRTLVNIEEDAKDKDGNLKPLTELDFLTRNFTRMSSINHPIFRAAWDLIQSELFEQRQILRTISDDVENNHKAVAQWAKSNGMSVTDAFSKIINFKTGNLISQTSQELNDKIDAAYADPDTERGGKQLMALLEVKDPEFDKKFKERYENYKKRMKYKYMDDIIGYKKAVENWYVSNNLSKHYEAWMNRYNRNRLQIKQSVKENNLSEDYKAIQNIKPLKDYYEMYMKYNNQFRHILGLNKYNKLPANFIPNIRKTMTESIAVDDIKESFKYIGTEFWDSFNVREEDVYISDIDASGDIKRTIPILFLNPLTNKNREIDNTKKSYDLSKNLLLFSKMAYNHQSMSRIEPKIMGMKELMAYPTAEQGGTQVLDSYGRKVTGKIKEYATKKGFDTDTYKLFEDLTDYYLYGIKFKSENSLGNSAKLTHTLLKLKNYYAKKSLSFAVVPGLGAYIAGNVAGFFEGVKGVNYTKDNIKQAFKNKTTEFKKYKAISLFFDVYAEDPINAMSDAQSANFLTKIATTRNMFYPLRKTDELINDEVLNRVSLNWGIDIDNKTGLGVNALVRLNRPDLDTTGIKSIYELTTLDDKSGKIIVKGLQDEKGKIINKEAYIAFRNAVKSTSGSIIGSLSQEDISRIDVVLIYNLMFQFKTWAPEIIRERFGNLRYDPATQAVRWGRYKAAFAEYGLSASEREGAQKINNFISQIVLPNMGRMVLDIMTFGIGAKHGLAGITKEYTDPRTGKVRRIRSNQDRAKLMYNEWIRKTGQDYKKVTFEMFLETKEAQMRAMMTELRTIMIFISTLLFLGADGDDDGKPRYMESYLGRLIFKGAAKANSELTFLMSPAQLAQMVRNPLPVASVLTDFIKLFKNTFDEGRDVIFGENSPYDKSPAFFYTIQMAYGGNQLSRFLELYQQYEKNPYPVIALTGQ
jgi:hypothetical protein